MDDEIRELTHRALAILERIANAIERDRAADNKTAPSKRQTKRIADRENLENTGACVAAYIAAWQRRYNTKARPALGGKEMGTIGRIVKERGAEKTTALLEIYCQMKEPWFVTKRHDLITFEQNLGKVDLALHAGHEMTSINWGDVFGAGMWDTTTIGDTEDGKKLLPKTSGPNEKDVGR